MAMEISSTYSSYIGNSTYATKSNNQKQTTESDETGKIISETNSSTKKTAADELTYLTEKYDDFCFIAANYTKGMRYGTNATTNVAISPTFLKKMANDPELEKEYESYFEDMKRLDAENIRSHEARGRRMVAQGWAIDKNGGISRWGISEPTDKRHYGQEMTDYANKIRKEKAEKVKEQEKIKEKREARKEKQKIFLEKRIENGEEKKELDTRMDMRAREVFGDKYIGSEMEYRKTDKPNADKETPIVIGGNLDMKL